jgi:hypothetical protein
MQFDQEGHRYKFQGITAGSPEVISSHRMEKLLKKGHSGVIAQLHAIQVIETPSVLQDLQAILSKHQSIFPLPKASLLPMVFMIIPFPCTRKSSSQYPSLSSPLFPKK